GFSMQGNVIGNGVTIVMLQGALTFGAQANANLTPPGTGDMGLAVIVQPSTNTSTITVRGGSSMMIDGTLYAPAATVSLAGNSSATGTGPQMGDVVICNRLSIAGTAQVRIGG